MLGTVMRDASRSTMLGRIDMVHRRGLGLPAASPVAQGALGVKVQQVHPLALFFCRKGDTGGQGAFAGAAFPGDEGQDAHDCTIAQQCGCIATRQHCHTTVLSRLLRVGA